VPSNAELRFPFGCDPRLKLAVALVGWLLVLAASNPVTSGAIAALVGASLVIARVSARVVARPLAAGAFTALVAVVLRVALTRGAPAIELHVLGWALPISREGLHAAGVLGARVLGALAVGAWLTATSSPAELVRALAWFRVPGQLLDILALAARYVSVLRDVMETARAAQTLRLGYRNFRSSLGSLGVLAGLTVGRALDQAIVTGQAMQLRGCGAELDTGGRTEASQGNLRLIALSLGGFSLSVALSRGWPW
jgi:cobalt/nickel transport system permease protein